MIVETGLACVWLACGSAVQNYTCFLFVQENNHSVPFQMGIGNLKSKHCLKKRFAMHFLVRCLSPESQCVIGWKTQSPSPSWLWSLGALRLGRSLLLSLFHLRMIVKLNCCLGFLEEVLNVNVMAWRSFESLDSCYVPVWLFFTVQEMMLDYLQHLQIGGAL